MDTYRLTGMSCAACAARVEKAVNSVEGVESCAVSLLTNSMGVNGTAKPQDIIKAVEQAGYGASSDTATQETASADDPVFESETPALKKRLLTSLVFLLVLMYISMGHGMLGWYIPPFIDNPLSVAVVEMLLAIVIMTINGKFFVNGFKTLFRLSPDMDTLVALGSSASFGYSAAVLLIMCDAAHRGDMDTVMRHSMDLYFESAAMIPTLITVGKLLESISKGRTTDALKSLIKMSPHTANVIRDGKSLVIPAEEVVKGDIFEVHPGEMIPVDGTVSEGLTAVDESALTGESIPADKKPGDKVSAATINTSGYIKCTADRVGSDTTISQIIKLISDAAATKAPIARIADKAAGVFVPVVIALSVITLVIWLIAGRPFSFCIARAISVLVISCPCALGLATPVAVMVGNGVGAKNGILFKTAAALEAAGRTEIAVLDKTGTVTNGTPTVTGIYPADGISEEELLQTALSAEARSEHPLARAVANYAKDIGLKPLPVSEFKVLPGVGIEAVYEGHLIRSGNDIAEHLNSEQSALSELLSAQGMTPLYFASDDGYMGMIAVADTIRDDSAAAVSELAGMGIAAVMLTGDNPATARSIAEKAGIKHVIAQVMPDDKEQVVRRLQEVGKVAMTGDGINDAPALTRADTGLAIGAGTDVAIDSADVVLMNSRLSDVSAAVRLSRATLRNIRQNLFWAFFYNIICIPLAAGVFIPLNGWEMSPMIGAAAMSLSSFFVCTNALRLNLVNIRDPRRDRPINRDITALSAVISDIQSYFDERKNKTMTKTMTIEGMMCSHCEANVKKALEAVEGVTAAEVSHEKGTAVVELSADVADDVLRAAVEAKDYKVKGIA